MSIAETNPAPEQPAPEQTRPGTNAVDLQKLTDKVYRLMLADIRLERARGMSTTRRGEIAP